MHQCATAAIAIGLVSACALSAPPAPVTPGGAPLAALSDPAVIARGDYLVNGPGHCAACHSEAGPLQAIEPTDPPALSGGYAFPVPGGTVRAPNLTPDSATGIGRLTDEELVGALRYGRRPAGGGLLPYMEAQGLSDEDLVAVLSYLRSRAPVRHAVRVREIGWLGRRLIGLLVQPRGPAGRPPTRSPAPPSAERGDYLANGIAACAACHTRRSRSGGYTGERFAGGLELRDELNPTLTLVTPNLTPDSETGRITRWTEEQFVARFRAGRKVPGSSMPWTFFAVMSDDDLRSIYRYLMSLGPVRHEVSSISRSGR